MLRCTNMKFLFFYITSLIVWLSAGQVCRAATTSKTISEVEHLLNTERYAVMAEYPFVIVSDYNVDEAPVMTDSLFNALAVGVRFQVGKTEVNTNSDFFQTYRQLLPFLQREGYQLRQLFLRGAASPEGNYENNRRLGQGRTEALQSLIKATSSASDPFYRGIVAYNEYAPYSLPDGKSANEYGHIVYNFFDKSIANNVKDENTLAEVHGKTTIEMQSGSFIGTHYTSTNPATDITDEVLLSTLNGSIYYSTHHLEQWPKVMADVYTETELNELAKHCQDNRYYEHRVAKYPWVY